MEGTCLGLGWGERVRCATGPSPVHQKAKTNCGGVEVYWTAPCVWEDRAGGLWAGLPQRKVKVVCAGSAHGLVLQGQRQTRRFSAGSARSLWCNQWGGGRPRGVFITRY